MNNAHYKEMKQIAIYCVNYLSYDNNNYYLVPKSDFFI